MAVVVQEFGGKRRIRLDAEQTRMFRRELTRARRDRPAKRLPAKLAPDCVVRDRTPAGRMREYELYGRTVLYDTRRDEAWQFYFGLLLLEWLEGA